MKFIVSWTIPKASVAVSEARFLKTGAPPPAGVKMLGRWHGMSGGGVLIAETESIAKGTSLQIKAEMARTRDASDEIAALAKRLEAVKIVLVLPKEALAVGSSDLIRTVLQKAPCEVILR